MNKLLIIVLTVTVAGCAVGPDYDPPEVSQAAAYFSTETEKDAASISQSANEIFWQGFQDPILTDLISQTLNSNFSLQAMLARYRKAAALLQVSRREQWPGVTAFGSASDQRLAAMERTHPSTDHREFYEIGTALHWEIDFFGRVERTIEASRADFEASGADLQAMQVALVGQLASSYFELRGLQQQLSVAEQNVDLQQSSLDIVSARIEAGRGTTFDSLRAEAQLHATRATVPDLHAAIRANMHRIAVLTGNDPGALIKELGREAPLPNSQFRIPIDTPGEVLRRRPDIRAAERRVAAASARIGVATADLFPRFTLEGLLGSVAPGGGELLTREAEYRRVTLGVDWTFLDSTRVRARIDAANADSVASLAEYQQAVLLALEETETWLVRYHHAQRRVTLLSRAEISAGQAVARARDRYEQGYIDYFELLGAELEFTQARDALVRSQTLQALAMVNVYRSLAGAPGNGDATLASRLPSERSH